jgi:hypothetical protein
VKASKAEQIESKYGKPLGDVLRDMFEQHGTQSGVARALEVTQGSVWQWLKQLRLRPVVTLVEDSAAPGATAQSADHPRLPGFDVEREV